MSEMEPLGPVIAVFDDIAGRVQFVTNYSYDADLRLRRVKIQKEGAEAFLIVPILFSDGTLGLEVRPS